MMEPSKRVLVVEDNDDSRYLCTLLLEERGYHVIGAANGMEALAALDQDRFAFVVLDVQLPDIDGFEVAGRIRRIASENELPIIVVSAFAMTSDRKKALAAGCNGYLEKPIDAEHFVSQLHCLAGVVPNA
jgi:two-component system, cell cycle response regulator DivK